LQQIILSQIDPAVHIVQFHPGFLPPARAVLVRHRNIHWTNEIQVAQAIVDTITNRVVVVAQQQQPPPPGPAFAAVVAVPDPPIPVGPADAAVGDVSSAVRSCDKTVALANNWTGTSTVIRPTGCSSRGGTAEPAVVPTLPGPMIAATAAGIGHNKRPEAENQEEEEDQRKKKKKKQRPGPEVNDDQNENKEGEDDHDNDGRPPTGGATGD
jgi:hypothetical protein